MITVTPPQGNVQEFFRLYHRLLYPQGNAFFCVTVNASSSHIEIAEGLCNLFSADYTDRADQMQIIDFKDIKGDFIFSSEFIRNSINEHTSILFLLNFHLACGDIPDAEFFQILNLSRDALAQLPIVMVFMMPLYFRIQIARNAPDFNSFFAYRADFTYEENESGMFDPYTAEQYSDTKAELLEYYEAQYNALLDHESKEALELLIRILRLNKSVSALSYIECKRFYELFEKLLPLHQNEIEIPLTDIAEVYESQGDYAAALKWLNEALALSIKEWGAEHHHTGSIYNAIGLAYDNLGDYPKALELHMKALAVCEKIFGSEHINVATVYNNIALAYSNQGDYATALEWYWKALSINDRTLGKEHISTALTYSNIAAAYAYQGSYFNALQWNEKALGVREKMLGKNHPLTAMSHNNIGFVYGRQGDYHKAIKRYLEALQILEKVLGKGHPETAMTCSNIAFMYYCQRNYTNALMWYCRSYKALLSSLGDKHLTTERVKENIRLAHSDSGIREPFELWLQTQTQSNSEL